MKRLGLAFALWALLSHAAVAQIGGLSLPGPGPIVVASGNDPATTAWVNQVVTRGATVSGTQTTRVNTLIVCLKTGATNLFAIADIFLLQAAENTAQATTDLITPSRTQATSTATFNAVGGTAPFGYAGDGTSTFYDTKWDPSTGTNYTLNSGTILHYDGSTTFGAGAGRTGVTDGTNEVELRFTSTTGIAISINGAASGSGQTVTNVKSIFIGSRTGATATQYYQNGTAKGGVNADAAGTARPTGFTYWAAGGQNLFNNFAFGYTDTMGAFAAFSGLNGTQVTQLNTCLQAYLTAWGA